MNKGNGIIVIGGSSGSIKLLINIFSMLPRTFHTPIIIVVHRMKNVESKLVEFLSSKHIVTEPEDKEQIENGRIYLAPQNYHLLVEESGVFSLDYSEPVNYSMPSIDVTFESIAKVYGSGVMGILLSGANKDGAAGLLTIYSSGGTVVVQDPQWAECPVMPQSGLELVPAAEVLSIEEIAERIKNYNT